MMRRDVDGANPASRNQLTQRADVQATIVDVHGQDLGAGKPECFPRWPVPRIFDGNGIAWPNQRMRQQRQCHLAAARHHDRRGVDGQAPREREHERELLAKASQPCRMVVGEQLAPERADRAAIVATDQFCGQQANIRARA